MPKTLVVALGGNALIENSNRASIPAQYQAASRAARSLGPLIAKGHNIVIVHGNGPQVGFILRRVELARGELHDVPLDSCVADSQGALGYNIQMAMRNEIGTEGRSAATVVTQVLVDRADPAFLNPIKPIGSFMDEKRALKHSESDGWMVKEDAGRGWRRVVPSPEPIEILELDVIRALVESGVITIAAGGGGIPVVLDDDGKIKGVEAVIDKDRAASLLARSLNVDNFVISTAVPRVCVDFGKSTERELEVLSVTEARTLVAEGQFAPGSMLPKIQALVDFVQTTGREGLICDLLHLSAALKGAEGTRIVP